MCGEMVAIGQVAMATGHRRQQAVWIGDAKSLIGGQPLAPLERNGTRVCGGNAMPREVQRIGDMGRSASKVVANVLFDYCTKYYIEVLRAIVSQTMALEVLLICRW